MGYKIRWIFNILTVGLAAAVFLGLSLAAAENSPVETGGKPIAAKTKPWKFELNGGITINSGNTETRVYNGGIQFEITLDKFSIMSNFDASYGSSKGEKVEDKGKWMNTFTFKLTDRVNAYAKVMLEYDVIADLALQTTLGLGMQYLMVDAAHTKAKIGTTINGEFTDAFAIMENIESLGFGLDASLEHSFSKTAKFEISSSFTSNFKEFLVDYKIDCDAAVSVMMINPLWIKIKIKDKYVNQTLLPELKHNDFTLVTSLELSF